MSIKTIYGIFDDEEILLKSVREIRSNNINIKDNIQKNLDFLFSSDGGDLTKINGDLQRLVEEMKEKNTLSSNTSQNTNKKKKRGKKA